MQRTVEQEVGEEEDEGDEICVEVDEDGRISGSSDLGLDYSFRCFPNFLDENADILNGQNWLENIVSDCKEVNFENFTHNTHT